MQRNRCEIGVNAALFVHLSTTTKWCLLKDWDRELRYGNKILHGKDGWNYGATYVKWYNLCRIVEHAYQGDLHLDVVLYVICTWHLHVQVTQCTTTDRWLCIAVAHLNLYRISTFHIHCQQLDKDEHSSICEPAISSQRIRYCNQLLVLTDQ